MKKILLAVFQAAVAAVAVHAVVLALRGDGREAPAPALDEQAGRIRAVEVHYAPGSAFAIRTYVEFFRQLPADVTVYVAVEKKEHFEEFVRLTGREAIPLVIGKPITTWARDRFIACADGSVVIPPEPKDVGAERRNDRLVPFALARETGATTRIAPFIFDGGDFCAAYGKIFCSSTWVARNPGRPLDELLRLAEGTFGMPVVYLPVAPRHHVGMVFAPVGGRRFLVGDVRWGRRLAPSGFDADLTEETARAFDAVAEELAAAGFDVSRVPALPTTTEFAWVTYTNGIFEDRTVWMPSFGIAAIDAAAAEVYRGLGFDVRPVDVSGDFRHGGTLHCLVHVVKRG